MNKLPLLWSLLLLLFLGCNGANTPPQLLPTPAQPDAVKTAILKTQNAPPAGFDSTAFNPVDYNRDLLPSVYFEVRVDFAGQYTETSEEAQGEARMQVWENNLLRHRRVILSFEGGVMSGGIGGVEAVRFENDFYLLDNNNLCTKNTQVAQDIATLTAGRLVGGYTLGLPTGKKDSLGALGEAYQYGFGEENLVLNIFRQNPSRVGVEGAEAWVLPAYQIVGRFGVVLQVEGAQILFGERPATGTLSYEYEVMEIGKDVNIALPNGC